MFMFSMLNIGVQAQLKQSCGSKLLLMGSVAATVTQSFWSPREESSEQRFLSADGSDGPLSLAVKYCQKFLFELITNPILLQLNMTRKQKLQNI